MAAYTCCTPCKSHLQDTQPQCFCLCHADTRAWEVDTLRGHVNNVSCVMFHARQVSLDCCLVYKSGLSLQRTVSDIRHMSCRFVDMVGTIAVSTAFGTVHVECMCTCCGMLVFCWHTAQCTGLACQKFSVHWALLLQHHCPVSRDFPVTCQQHCFTDQSL